MAFDCIQTKDGGYLSTGFKEIILPPPYYVIKKSFLIKFDAYGNILWGKIIGDTLEASVSNHLTEDPFGNIYLNYDTGDEHLLKLDSQGRVLWSKDFSAYHINSFGKFSFVENYNRMMALSQTELQGYWVTSITKLDTSGNLVFNKVYYDSLSPFGTYACSGYYFSNNEYYVCGFSQPYKGVENRIGLILKTDTSGNLIWNKRFPSNKGLYSIAQNSESYFIASGQAETSGYLFCQKFDSSGNLIWSRNYIQDPIAGAISGVSIIKNPEGNFALGSSFGHYYGRLVVIDSLGIPILGKYYYYPASFYISQYNINNTSDSGYIISGSLDSNNTADPSPLGNKQIDILIFKIDKYGNTVKVSQNHSHVTQDPSIEIFPNPFNFSFKLKLTLNERTTVNVYLFDIMGRIVKRIDNIILDEGKYEFPIQTPELSSGIYFLSTSLNDQYFSKKVLLIK